MKTEIICKQCGIPAMVLTAERRRGNGLFCGILCRNIWNSRHGRASRGGKIHKPSGYTDIRINGDYQAEHTLIAEKALGKPLPVKAVVHHHNEMRSDNRNANLVICENNGYHRLLHARMRILKAGGHPDQHRICCTCHALKLKKDCPRARCHECDRIRKRKSYHLLQTHRESRLNDS